MKSCEILIAGAGAAGLSAAAAAWEAGCRDVLLADRAGSPGGVLPQCLHEGFGLAAYGRELTGPDYARRLAERLAETGVRLLLNTEILSVSAEKKALLSGPGGLEELGFQRLILAAGSRERTAGELLLGGTRPAGVFTAGQAQALINLGGRDIGDRAVILGSGDLGLIMARQLTLAGKQVLALVEREDRYGGMARNVRRCIGPGSIPVLFRTTVTELYGQGRLEAVRLTHLDSGESERLPCDTLLIAAGLVPERALIRDLGSPDWLTLCGNCRRIHDLADSAAAEGAEAGRAAARDLLSAR